MFSQGKAPNIYMNRNLNEKISAESSEQNQYTAKTINWCESWLKWNEISANKNQNSQGKELMAEKIIQ